VRGVGWRGGGGGGGKGGPGRRESGATQAEHAAGRGWQLVRGGRRAGRCSSSPTPALPEVRGITAGWDVEISFWPVAHLNQAAVGHT